MVLMMKNIVRLSSLRQVLMHPLVQAGKLLLRKFSFHNSDTVQFKHFQVTEQSW